MKCGNKDGIRAISPWRFPPHSCCFSVSFTYSLHASKLASISFVSFVTLSSSLIPSLFLLLTLFSPAPIHSDSPRPETVLLAMCMMGKACAASPTAASLHLAPTKLICFFGHPRRMSELMIIFFSPLSCVRAVELESSSVICCLWRMKMCEVRRVQGRLWTPVASSGGDCKHNCLKWKKSNPQENWWTLFQNKMTKIL